MEYIVLWILALFGLWDLISRMIESLYIDNRNGEVEILVKVKNQEKIIEPLIKSLLRISVIGKIKVIDMNSSDSTVKILKNIEAHNPMIEIFQEKQ